MTSCPICHRFGWFTDEAVAEHAPISTARRPREKRREHRRYPCPVCGGWHLTSKRLPEGQDA